MLVTGPRAKRHAYKVSCPVCHALAGHFCVTSDGEVSRYAHAKRDKAFTPNVPDLRRWWREMAPYEGVHRKRRPADLVVP